MSKSKDTQPKAAPTPAPAPKEEEQDKFNLDGIEVKRRQSQYTKFTLPSNLKQLTEVVRLEFKQYFKSKLIIVLYILAAALPLVQISGIADPIGMLSGFLTLLSGNNDTTSLQYLHYCLILMPTVMVLAMTILCGKTISQEYEGRTCFLNLPLPVERWVFFTGKFVAIGITSFSVILFGYGFSMLATNIKYGEIAVEPVIQSIIIAFFAMFALIATGMFFSSVCKKRGGVLAMLTIMFFIPLVPLAFTLINDTGDLINILNIFLYTPPFSTDAMLISLGWDPTLSLSGFYIGQFANEAPSFIGTILASLVWTAAFFGAGVFMFKGREV